MRTKFILHGGMLKYNNPSNDSYFKELTKDLKDGDEVLFIGFARPDKQERLNVYERDKGLILSQAKAKITVINATQDKLIDQAKRAKAIHVTGGETDVLVADITRQPGFVAAIKGKVIGGSSAGACLFSKYYFFGEKNQVLEGLGTLPICVLVHYGSKEYNSTDEALGLLRAHSNGLEVVPIKECDRVVKEVNL